MHTLFPAAKVTLHVQMGRCSFVSSTQLLQHHSSNLLKLNLSYCLPNAQPIFLKQTYVEINDKKWKFYIKKLTAVIKTSMHVNHVSVSNRWMHILRIWSFRPKVCLVAFHDRYTWQGDLCRRQTEILGSTIRTVLPIWVDFQGPVGFEICYSRILFAISPIWCCAGHIQPLSKIRLSIQNWQLRFPNPIQSVNNSSQWCSKCYCTVQLAPIPCWNYCKFGGDLGWLPRCLGILPLS